MRIEYELHGTHSDKESKKPALNIRFSSNDHIKSKLKNLGFVYISTCDTLIFWEFFFLFLTFLGKNTSLCVDMEEHLDVIFTS